MANPLTAYKAWVVDNGAVVKKFEDTARMLTMFLPVNFHKYTRMSTPRMQSATQPTYHSARRCH